MFTLFLRRRSANISQSYTYFVDPVGGNDGNNGRTAGTAWKTTTHADAESLFGTETVGYKYNGEYFLYRKLNMTAAEAQLAANLVSATADEF